MKGCLLSVLGLTVVLAVLSFWLESRSVAEMPAAVRAHLAAGEDQAAVKIFDEIKDSASRAEILTEIPEAAVRFDTARAVTQRQAATQKKAAEREAQVARFADQFSFDRHYRLENAVERQLNDPESFQHDATGYVIDDDLQAMTVHMNFRARNGFGGVVRSKATARIDAEGHILSLEIK